MQRLKTPPQSKRNGASLIELVIVMGVATTLLGTSLGMIHTMMKAESASSDQLGVQTSLSRLSRVLREDGHQSESAVLTIEDDLSVLTLKKTADTAVAYTIDNDELKRTVTKGDAIEHRERFRLGNGLHYHWKLDDEPQVLRLTIRQSIDPTKRVTDQTRLVVNLTTVIGRDRE